VVGPVRRGPVLPDQPEILRRTKNVTALPGEKCIGQSAGRGPPAAGPSKRRWARLAHLDHLSAQMLRKPRIRATDSEAGRDKRSVREHACRTRRLVDYTARRVDTPRQIVRDQDGRDLPVARIVSNSSAAHGVTEGRGRRAVIEENEGWLDCQGRPTPPAASAPPTALEDTGSPARQDRAGRSLGAPPCAIRCGAVPEPNPTLDHTVRWGNRAYP